MGFNSDEEKYFLNDEKGETELGCQLSESVRKASSSPLFKVSFCVFSFLELNLDQPVRLVVFQNSLVMLDASLAHIQYEEM